MTRGHEAAALSSEGGFTLVEMLVSCVVGVIVMLAAYALLDVSNGLSRSVADRVDSTQRARDAMEQVTRELRSQVCLQPGTAAITTGQDSSVTFYAFMGTGAYSPDRHTITWNPATRQLVDYTFAGTGTAPNMTYPPAPTRTTTLVDNVDPVPGAPIFSYYTWAASGPVGATRLLPAPLSASDQQKTVRISVQFRVTPNGNSRASANQTTTIQDDVVARTADPNAAGGPGLPDCG